MAAEIRSSFEVLILFWGGNMPSPGYGVAIASGGERVRGASGWKHVQCKKPRGSDTRYLAIRMLVQGFRKSVV